MSLELKTRAEIATELGYTKRQLDNLFSKIYVKPRKFKQQKFGQVGLYSAQEVRFEIEKYKSAPKVSQSAGYLLRIENLKYEGIVGGSLVQIAKQLKCAPCRIRTLVKGKLEPVCKIANGNIYEVDKVLELYKQTGDRKSQLSEIIRAADYDRSKFGIKFEIMARFCIDKIKLNNLIAREKIKPTNMLLECDARTAIYSIQEIGEALARREQTTLEARRKAAENARRYVERQESNKKKRIDPKDPIEEKVAKLRSNGMKVLAIARQLAEPVDKVYLLVEAYDKAIEAENQQKKEER